MRKWSNQWLIDAVESEHDNVADWSVFTGDDKVRQLVIRLKRSASVRRPTQLFIKGHRATTVGTEITGRAPTGAFRTSAGQRLLAVRRLDGNDLETLNAGELSRRDPANLAAAEAGLFPEPPTGLVFAIDATGPAEPVAGDAAALLCR